MMRILVRNHVFSVLIILSAQTLAQNDEIVGACAIAEEELIITEHIMSLHTGRAPLEIRPWLKAEVIRIRSNALRRENPLLNQREAEEQSEQWLNHELDELENQDQDQENFVEAEDDL